jgi:hypothetical protein
MDSKQRHSPTYTTHRCALFEGEMIHRQNELLFYPDGFELGNHVPTLLFLWIIPNFPMLLFYLYFLNRFSKSKIPSLCRFIISFHVLNKVREGFSFPPTFLPRFLLFGDKVITL